MRNFRKPNHTKASGNARWKTCVHCRRKYPPGEFIRSRRVSRRGIAEYVQGPRYRTVELHYDRCGNCRRLPSGIEQLLKDDWRLRTPIRMAYLGLPFP